jgi:hypothetical protein
MMHVNISILTLPNSVRLVLSSQLQDIVPEYRGCEEAVLVSAESSG